jgi:hypothetical protein
MVPKPKVMPSICGTMRRKPKFAAEVVTSTTFGSGVGVTAAANSGSDPSNHSCRRNAPNRRQHLNYMACVVMLG